MSKARRADRTERTRRYIGRCNAPLSSKSERSKSAAKRRRVSLSSRENEKPDLSLAGKPSIELPLCVLESLDTYCQFLSAVEFNSPLSVRESASSANQLPSRRNVNWKISFNNILFINSSYCLKEQFFRPIDIFFLAMATGSRFNNYLDNSLYAFLHRWGI